VYRIIQWTTGVVGRSALSYGLDRPDLTLVGAKCHSPSKAGQDLGEIVGRQPIGIETTQDEESLLGLEADCVIFTPNDTAQRDPTIPGTPSHENFQTALRILRSGKNVVSPLCPPAHFRHFDDPALFRRQVDEACQEGQSSIHFTGSGILYRRAGRVAGERSGRC